MRRHWALRFCPGRASLRHPLLWWGVWLPGWAFGPPVCQPLLVQPTSKSSPGVGGGFCFWMILEYSVLDLVRSGALLVLACPRPLPPWQGTCWPAGTPCGSCAPGRSSFLSLTGLAWLSPCPHQPPAQSQPPLSAPSPALWDLWGEVQRSPSILVPSRFRSLLDA